MTKRLKPTLLVAFFSALAGCAAASVAHITFVSAQGPVRSEYSECFASTLNSVTVSRRNAGELPQAVDVRGWTPIGGTTTHGLPTVVLCR